MTVWESIKEKFAKLKGNSDLGFVVGLFIAIFSFSRPCS